MPMQIEKITPIILNKISTKIGMKINIANISDKERFKHYLKNHQRGQTDYATFCNHSAETGVEKWTVDMSEMTCTYFDKSNTKMFEEQIPAP